VFRANGIAWRVEQVVENPFRFIEDKSIAEALCILNLDQFRAKIRSVNVAPHDYVNVGGGNVAHDVKRLGE